MFSRTLRVSNKIYYEARLERHLKVHGSLARELDGDGLNILSNAAHVGVGLLPAKY
jgi:hypothetical protein